MQAKRLRALREGFLTRNLIEGATHQTGALNVNQKQAVTCAPRLHAGKQFLPVASEEADAWASAAAKLSLPEVENSSVSSERQENAK
eukprot:1144459-Pelagomonas_calceolata.AAC.2